MEEMKNEERSEKKTGREEKTEAEWEWFCSIPGIYRTQREILLRCFEDPKGLLDASREELEYLGTKGCRWIWKVIEYRKKTDPAQTVNARRKKGIHFISCLHSAYPQRLRLLRDYPYGLFWKGKLPGKERTVAIVGARMCTPGGKGMAETIAARIAQCGGAVVSGAAYGIDGAAQWAALGEGGESFAVLGCGADLCYPSSHRRLFDRLEERGGLISEFPPGTGALPIHFPMRNRIISGLSDAVAVIEARKRSGSLITAEFALDQGKPVYAVPGRPEDELSMGCNLLISQGASMILSAESFAEQLFPSCKREKKQISSNIVLAPAEKLVYSTLGMHAKSMWELEENTSLSLSELSDSLLSLELKGLIRETEQNFYVKVK